MAKKPTGPSIDLGEIQQTFQVTKRAAQAAEAVLKRSQEARDRAKAAAQAAEAALRDATRALLG